MKAIFLGLILTMAMMSCQKENIKKEVDPIAIDYVKTALKETGLDLLKESYTNEGNSLISPLSIQMALYMLSEGAKENTLSELMSGLHLPPDGSTAASAESLLNRFNHSNSNLNITLKNACFYNNALSLNSEFENTLKTSYYAYLKNLDFKDTKSVSTINSWVEKSTNGKIKKVLSSIDPNELLFLINTLYMKADWDNAFPVKMTKKDLFYNHGQQKVSVDFMNNDAIYKGLSTDDLDYIELSMADSSLVCKLIMPKVSSIKDYLNTMTIEEMNNLKSKATTGKFRVKIPKMTLRFHEMINPWIKGIGITKIFSENADLSGISATVAKIRVSRILHDTYFEMNEEGAKGAAATTIRFVLGSTLPPALHFNRPFILMVEDVASGIPLFSGVVQEL